MRFPCWAVIVPHCVGGGWSPEAQKWSRVRTETFSRETLHSSKVTLSAGWVAQLVGVLSRATIGCGFDSWSGHIPRLQVRCWSVRGREATDPCFLLTSMFLSLFLPTSLSLKINKNVSSVWIKKKPLPWESPRCTCTSSLLSKEQRGA